MHSYCSPKFHLSKPSETAPPPCFYGYSVPDVMADMSSHRKVSQDFINPYQRYSNQPSATMVANVQPQQQRRTPLQDYNRTQQDYFSRGSDISPLKSNRKIQQGIECIEDEKQRAKQRIEELQNIINELNKEHSRTNISRNFASNAYKTECPPSRALSQNRQQYTPEGSQSPISRKQQQQEGHSTNHPLNMETWIGQSQLQQYKIVERSRMLTPPPNEKSDGSILQSDGRSPFSDLFTRYIQTKHTPNQKRPPSPNFNNTDQPSNNNLFSKQTSQVHVRPFKADNFTIHEAQQLHQQQPLISNREKKVEDFNYQLNQFLNLHRDIPEETAKQQQYGSRIPYNSKPQQIMIQFPKEQQQQQLNLCLTVNNFNNNNNNTNNNSATPEPQSQPNPPPYSISNLLKMPKTDQRSESPFAQYKSPTTAITTPATSASALKKDYKQQSNQNQPDNNNNILSTILPDSQIESNLDAYNLGKVLGLGSYAVVRMAHHKTNTQRVAIKTYEKAKLADPQKRKNVTREIKILSKLRHPHIIKLQQCVETTAQLHLIMEYSSATSLNAFIKQKPQRKLHEDETRFIFRQIVDAVKYCHYKNVVHRDIKLENLLVDDQRYIKLIDFGFSIAIDPASRLNVFCGTPSYMAPEIVNKVQYSFPADIWALGILLFKMITGAFPFRGCDDKELYKRINAGKIEYPCTVSQPVKSLIARLLRVNQDDRPSAKEILNDEWFQIKDDEQSL